MCKHKTKREEFKNLKENPEKYIDWIKQEAEHFKNDIHTPKEIYDGIQRKKRTIIVPTFREQIIHHMVVNILKPIIMKSIIGQSYGSIPGRGAHLAKKHIEKMIRKGEDIKYCLKMDIKKYFDSIPHDKLKAFFERKIKDQKFLGVLNEITDVIDHGMPLGFYTSQWIANWYLSNLDHYIKEHLYAPHYYRYMDDMVIFGSNKRKLHKTRLCIEKELKDLGLEMKSNWQVFRFTSLDFMGFRFWRDRTTLRRKIMLKATRKARRIAKKQRITAHDARQMLSYLGWFKCTDTYNVLENIIFKYVDLRELRKIISNADKKKAT